MSLTTRYGFVDAPNADGTGWATLSAEMGNGDLTLTVTDPSLYPSAREFDINVGLRNVTTGAITNQQRMHVTGVSGNVFTVTRTDTSIVHAAGETVINDWTAEGVEHNPGAMTDAGDMQYLGSDGRMARLAAPADGSYVPVWASGVISWAASAIVATSVAANLILAGPAAGADAAPAFRSLVAADIANAAPGTNGQLIYNNAGAFGGDAGLTYLADDSVYRGRLQITGTATAQYAQPIWLEMVAGDIAASWINGAYVTVETPFDGSGTQNINNLIGINAQAQTYLGAARTTDQVFGLFAAGANYGAGTATLVSAVRAELYSDGNGVTTVGSIFGGQAYTNAGDTFGDLNGVQIGWSIDAATTIANLRGISIGDISGVTVGGVKQAINYGDKFIVDSAGKVTSPDADFVALKLGGASVATQTYVGAQGYLTSVTAHNLLSATHGDTLTDSVVRGDLLYGNATPKWARLAKPSVLSGLSHDGTDVSWVTANGTGNPARTTNVVLITPTLGAASATSLLIGNGSASAPSFSFAGATTTGLFLQGAGVGLASSGVIAAAAYSSQFSIYSSLLTIGSGSDLFVTRAAAATMQLGQDVNGAAVSQIIQVANGITGTDKTGGNFTIQSGKGTGAGAVSQIIFKTPTVLGSGTTAQALAARLTLDSSGATFAVTAKTPAATTALSSLNIPHGTAPTSPLDGDVWTTSAGLYVRVNGSTVGPLS